MARGRDPELAYMGRQAQRRRPGEGCAICGATDTQLMRAVWPPGAPATCMDSKACAARAAAQGRKRSKATFRVQVHARGESGWTSNALSFESPEEAKRYGSDLFGRWYGIDAWRVLDGAGHVRHQEGDDPPGRSRTRRRSGRRSRLGVLRIG